MRQHRDRTSRWSAQRRRGPGGNALEGELRPSAAGVFTIPRCLVCGALFGATETHLATPSVSDRKPSVARRNACKGAYSRC